MAAVRQSEKALKFASPELRSDREFLLEAIPHSSFEFLQRYN